MTKLIPTEQLFQLAKQYVYNLSESDFKALDSKTTDGWKSQALDTTGIPGVPSPESLVEFNEEIIRLEKTGKYVPLPDPINQDERYKLLLALFDAVNKRYHGKPIEKIKLDPNDWLYL